ncbi:hypothetical protein NIES4106_47690 [Fischerella sp. NIES-4106]|nr:hypothetical protein NIES4106_47690 [Fischerella sp. NIES-4106]
MRLGIYSEAVQMRSCVYTVALVRRGIEGEVLYLI